MFPDHDWTHRPWAGIRLQHQVLPGKKNESLPGAFHVWLIWSKSIHLEACILLLEDGSGYNNWEKEMDRAVVAKVAYV